MRNKRSRKELGPPEAAHSGEPTFCQPAPESARITQAQKKGGLSLHILPSANRDFLVVLAAKSVRTFFYGVLGVIYPLYLTQMGAGPGTLGVAVTLTLLASAAFTLAIRRPAEKFGAKKALMTLSGLIMASGGLFLAARHPAWVVMAAMAGNIAVGTGETGPFLSLEQVVVSRESARHRLATRLSLYNLAGYVSAALGAAAAGWFSKDLPILFSLFLAGGAIQAAAYGLLSNRPAPARPVSEKRPAPPLVKRISALFALDSFAGGFILQSFMVYWFQKRFGVGIETLGWIFFSAQIMNGVSFLAAPAAARRIGLVNTMVFSHLLANALLAALVFSPSLAWAAALLWARHLLSQVDVPTRQTFLMLAVEDHERERAASLTNTSRTVAQAVSPLLSGWIMQAVSLGSPFLIGAGLKVIYDLALYRLVRRVPIP